MVKIRGIEFQANTDNDMGWSSITSATATGFSARTGPISRDVQIERKHYMAKSGVLSQTHHHNHACHHPYRRAGACSSGHALHRRGTAAALLRVRPGGIDPQEDSGSRLPATTSRRPAAMPSARMTSSSSTPAGTSAIRGRRLLPLLSGPGAISR